MVNKTTILDVETSYNLKKLDDWLSKQPWQKQVDIDTFYKVRELIIQIEEKGYYTQQERDVLNGVREYWFRSKYEGQWICSYCLQSTKDVDIDYLSGTDHLECQLKEEMK
jgi:hypothetical protein